MATYTEYTDNLSIQKTNLVNAMNSKLSGLCNESEIYNSIISKIPVLGMVSKINAVKALF